MFTAFISDQCYNILSDITTFGDITVLTAFILISGVTPCQIYSHSEMSKRVTDEVLLAETT